MNQAKGGKVLYTVPLNELEIMQMKMILVEGDGSEALAFLQDHIYGKIKESIHNYKSHQKMVDTQTPWAPGRFPEDLS